MVSMIWQRKRSSPSAVAYFLIFAKAGLQRILLKA
jgi:hypothetical protein